jgi:hypothetical protein
MDFTERIQHKKEEYRRYRMKLQRKKDMDLRIPSKYASKSNHCGA